MVALGSAGGVQGVGLSLTNAFNSTLSHVSALQDHAPNFWDLEIDTGKNDTLFKKPPNGTDAFLTSCAFNTGVFILGALAFCCIRQKFPDIYQPRCTKQVPLQQRPQAPPKGWFRWIQTVYYITEEDIYQSAGLDAVMFLRIIWLGMAMFGTFTVYGVLVLIPMNAWGSGEGEGIEKLSMSNISADIDRKIVYFHALGIYLFSFCVFWYCQKTYVWYIQMRQRFLRGTQPNLYSVMVRNLPKHLQSSTALANEMEDIFPGDVVSATVNVGHLQKLEILNRKRMDALKQLEKYAYRYKCNPTATRHKQYASVLNPFRQVDSIQYYAEEVKKLNQQISARQMEIKNKYTLYGYDIEVTSAAMANPLTMTRRRSSSSAKGTNRLQRKPSKAAQLLQRRHLTKEDTPRLTPTQRLQLLREQSHTAPVHTYSSATGTSFGGDSGFVMFKSHRAATMAVQCVPGSSLPGYHLVQAPDPSAVIWSNISHHNAYRFSTWITIWAAFIALTIVFTIPAATLASLTSLENISKIFPILNDICKNYPTIKGLLEGVLPQISIIAFYLVMPYVLYALGHFEGHLCWGDLELSVVRKWFMFQAVNVFLAPAVSASIIQTFNAAQKDISHIPELLGRAIPSASTFFINYAILRTCLTQVTEILRLGAVAYTYTGYWTSQTPRDRDAAKDPGRVMYGDILSRTLVLFLIGATYAVLAPLILPFVTLFFAASLFVWKYQLTYVYISQMDTGGLFWFVSFRRIIFSTIFAQITVFGIFSLKQSLAGVLVLPLPFISYGVLYYYTKWWKQRALFLTLNEAMRADLIVLSNQEDGNTNITQLADYGDMYLQPILTGKPMYPRLTEQFVADDDDSQNELTPEVAQLMRELAENDIAIDEIVDEEQPLLVSPE